MADGRNRAAFSGAKRSAPTAVNVPAKRSNHKGAQPGSSAGLVPPQQQAAAVQQQQQQQQSVALPQIQQAAAAAQVQQQQHHHQPSRPVPLPDPAARLITRHLAPQRRADAQVLQPQPAPRLFSRAANRPSSQDISAAHGLLPMPRVATAAILVEMVPDTLGGASLLVPFSVLCRCCGVRWFTGRHALANSCVLDDSTGDDGPVSFTYPSMAIDDSQRSTLAPPPPDAARPGWTCGGLSSGQASHYRPVVTRAVPAGATMHPPQQHVPPPREHRVSQSRHSAPGAQQPHPPLASWQLSEAQGQSPVHSSSISGGDLPIDIEAAIAAADRRKQLRLGRPGTTSGSQGRSQNGSQEVASGQQRPSSQERCASPADGSQQPAASMQPDSMAVDVDALNAFLTGAAPDRSTLSGSEAVEAPSIPQPEQHAQPSALAVGSPIQQQQQQPCRFGQQPAGGAFPLPVPHIALLPAAGFVAAMPNRPAAAAVAQPGFAPAGQLLAQQSDVPQSPHAAQQDAPGTDAK